MIFPSGISVRELGQPKGVKPKITDVKLNKGLS